MIMIIDKKYLATFLILQQPFSLSLSLSALCYLWDVRRLAYISLINVRTNQKARQNIFVFVSPPQLYFFLLNFKPNKYQFQNVTILLLLVVVAVAVVVVAIVVLIMVLAVIVAALAVPVIVVVAVIIVSTTAVLAMTVITALLLLL